MIKDITIGQYYPGDSILHRLDPRIKLVATFLFIISLFLFDTFYGYIVVFIFRVSYCPIKGTQNLSSKV